MTHTGQVSVTQSCAQCHLGDPIEYVHKFKCGTCHDPTTGVLQNEATNGPGECSNCHTARATDWTTHNFDHETQNRIILSADCVGCHDETLVPGQAFISTGNGKKHDACTICHKPDGSLTDAAFVAYGGSAGCTTCHLAFSASSLTAASFN